MAQSRGKLWRRPHKGEGRGRPRGYDVGAQLDQTRSRPCASPPFFVSPSHGRTPQSCTHTSERFADACTTRLILAQGPEAARRMRAADGEKEVSFFLSLVGCWPSFQHPSRGFPPLNYEPEGGGARERKGFEENESRNPETSKPFWTQITSPRRNEIKRKPQRDCFQKTRIMSGGGPNSSPTPGLESSNVVACPCLTPKGRRRPF